MKLFLFDIDGTLVNLNQAGLKALDKAFYDIFQIKDKVYKVNFYGKTDIIIYEEIAELSGISLKQLYTNIDNIMERFLVHLQIEINNINYDPVIPEVKNFLDKIILRNDIIIGLLTGNLEKGAFIKISRWGLDKYFKFGAYASDSKLRKDLVNIAVKRAEEISKDSKFKNNEIYVIGDTPLDIKCAKDNNVISIAVCTGKYNYEELSSFSPDFCVNNMNEINFI